MPSQVDDHNVEDGTMAEYIDEEGADVDYDADADVDYEISSEDDKIFADEVPIRTEAEDITRLDPAALALQRNQDKNTNGNHIWINQLRVPFKFGRNVNTINLTGLGFELT
ncbi:hypothetical protein Droror1_Dr00018226 [Drosera rotundifolia]